MASLRQRAVVSSPVWALPGWKNEKKQCGLLSDMAGPHCFCRAGLRRNDPKMVRDESLNTEPFFSVEWDHSAADACPCQSGGENPPGKGAHLLSCSPSQGEGKMI